LFLPDHDFPMASFLRIASSAARPILRTSTQVPRVVVPTVASKASAIRFYSDSHEESFEEFTAR
jgi:cytochrome c oxidase subunit 5a